jgi:hypothetical protein
VAGGFVFVGVGVAMLVLVGATVFVAVGRAAPGDVLVGVGVATLVLVGAVLVGVLLLATVFGVGVAMIDVLVGPSNLGRGVTVGIGLSITLPGVLVGAFWGAAIITTSSVGIFARITGVGLCAAAVARSAA